MLKSWIGVFKTFCCCVLLTLGQGIGLVDKRTLCEGFLRKSPIR